MTALTVRERAQVNAALSIIHMAGHDVPALQREVRNMTAQGKHARQAYVAVINRFVGNNPSLRTPITRMASLIEHSDDPTVAKYDSALSTYIRTGDESVVNALEPTVRADSVALAVRRGEVSAEQAASGQVDWGALGLADAQPPSAPQKFAWGGAAAPAAPGNGAEATQPERAQSAPFTPVTVSGSDTAVRIGQGWERHHAAILPTTSKPSPYAGLNPAQIKAAMTADAAVKTGWQREEDKT